MLEFRLSEHHFQQDGWTQYHLFMRGTRWEKENHIVIRDTLGYLYDGERAAEDYPVTQSIVEMQ